MDWTSYLRFLAALIFVLALIGGLAWLARRTGFGGAAVPRRGSGGRLRVEEVLALDPRRRLLLVRRDDREHLILLGAASDLVIETDIRGPRGPETPV
ncbi:MAG TPA: flagellar biosynthetic protein FliO [Alphaproteobacteria bacterium]|nr:flagellar biosynthetic protein FliO [Alphaproteobacteria bacterium]